ncbi:MAG TPA: CBS domain-containing protein [Candidatus Limnocylindria bacterium]|nr:CBS domain-containing protein [Candidatus Limnocylindria bacterium]
MTGDVECLAPDSTLQEAARKMKDLDVGSLPICDRDRLSGVLTDRDIVIRSVAAGQDPKSTQVRNVMTPEVIYCFEDQGVEDAARIMEEKQVRRLMVLNREKRLVGIVSLADLAVDAGDDVLSGEALEAISAPAQPKRRGGA